MTPRILVKVGLGVGVGVVLLTLISVAVPWWTYKQYEYFGVQWKHNTGLWRSCLVIKSHVQDSQTCTDIDNPEDWVVTTRVLMLLAMLISLLGVVVTSVHLCYLTDVPLVAVMAALMFLLTGLLTMVSVLVYGTGYIDSPGANSRHLDAAWGLTIVASSLSYITAVLLVAGKICGCD